MKLHGNARTCPKSRRLLVDRLEGDWSLTEAAEAAGVSERTACKWLDRYRTEGEAGLQDRSSAPHVMPGRTPESRVEAIAALRRLRMTGPEIAELLEMASSTVSAVLGRIGLAVACAPTLEQPQREVPSRLAPLGGSRGFGRGNQGGLRPFPGLGASTYFPVPSPRGNPF